MKQLKTNVFHNIKTGAFISIPVIITVLVVIWLFGWLKNVLVKVSFFLSKEQMEQHQYLYLIVLLAIFVIWGIIGKVAGKRGDEKLDKMVAKVPLISSIYSSVNPMFKLDGKGVQVTPVYLPVYNPHSTVLCHKMSDEQYWAYVPSRNQYDWCYLIVPPPFGNPIGGHGQYWPCDYIDQQLVVQNENPTSEESIKVCVTMGTVFPERLKKSNRSKSNSETK